MSIFRNTFTKAVQEQIKKRQEAINSRSPQAIHQLNTRNSWIRMTSSVNVFNPKTNEIDSALAKQYILQGGTLVNSPFGKGLKSGVGTLTSSAYSTLTPGGALNSRGIRPMPGIVSLDIKSRAAYGSLREVTVNFVCHSIEQLEELELLYMRPGYTVLVEWGWIPYLDNKEGKLISNIDYYDEVLEGTREMKDILLDLFKKSKDHSGNYDALFGKVMNYSWTARADGGYDCVTTLISVGEILESLKVNSAAFNITGIVNQNGLLKIPLTDTVATYDTLKQEYSKNILNGLLYELSSYLKHIKQGFPTNQIVHFTYSINNASYDLLLIEFPSTNTSTPTNSDPYKCYISLESFVKLLNNHVITAIQKVNKQPIAELSIQPNSYDDNIPANEQDSLLCLAHPLQVSVDVDTCIINNPIFAAGVQINVDQGAANGAPGNILNPATATQADKISNTQSYNIPYVKYLAAIEKSPNVKKFRSNQEVGKIGNIYLNIQKLQQFATEDNVSNKKEIQLYDYLKKIMTAVQESIGNVNNFDIHIDPIDNIARIIDVNYVDTESRSEVYKNAFPIELGNTKSIVRSYSIQSQIFPEQSHLIAIGAQVKGGQKGQTSGAVGANGTLLSFNNNIEDRILPKKIDPNDINNVKIGYEEEAAANLKASIETLCEYLFPQKSGDEQTDADGSVDVASIIKYKNALRDIILYIQNLTNSDTKNRSLIPVKISLTMDGIGGLIIGHLFKIPSELLPKGYKFENGVGSKLLQTVVGISHKVGDGNWTTTIDAYNMVLDNPVGSLTFDQLLQKTATGYTVNIPVATTAFSGPTPNADKLKTELTRLGINIKAGQLNNNGDITAELANVASKMFAALKTRFPGTQFTVTAGNDRFHANRSSLHPAGKGLDFTVTPSQGTKLVLNEIRAQFPLLTILDEYSEPSPGATGGHIHISI